MPAGSTKIFELLYLLAINKSDLRKTCQIQCGKTIHVTEMFSTVRF